MKYMSTCGTIKNTKINDKPNEDLVLCDDEEKIYILLDGVSRDRINGRYPNPSPAQKVSEIFAREAYNYLKQSKNKYNLKEIKKAFYKGNQAIENYNKQYNGDFLPGTVGIICTINEDKLYYGYIGDCYGRIIRNDEIKIFTRCQTEKIAIHKKEFSPSQIRNEICNNSKHPYAYGVLTGQETAIEFVVLGECSLEKNNMIILSSDGLEPFLKRFVQKEFTSKEAEYYLKKSILGSGEDDKAIIIIFNN